MSTVRRIAKNFLSLAVAGIIASLIGFVGIVYLARVLGPGDFGKINFAIAIVAYFMLIANLGLPMLGTREVARDKDRIKDYVGNIVTMRLTLGAIAFFLLLLFVFLINKPAEVKYLIILFGLGLFPFALRLLWLFQGIERMEYMAVSQIIGAILYVPAIFYFIRSPEQLLAVPLIYVICMLFLPALFLAFVFIRHFGIVKPKFEASFWKSLLWQALPMGFSFIMIQLYYNFDTIMLGFIRSNEEVGFYNAAYRVIFLLLPLGGFYYTAIFPVISNYYKTSLESLQRLLSGTAKLMVTIGLPLAIGGTLVARPLMRLIYGGEYNSGIIAFQILIWAVTITWVSGVYGNSLVACDRQKKYAVRVTIGTVGNIVLNFILIPPYGLVGASIATVFTEGVVLLLMYLESNKIVRVSLNSYILRPVIACLGMGIFLYFCSSWNVLVLILSGAVVYFVILFLIRGITKREITMIREQLFPTKV